ncbi:MAG: TetR/AcrR family transcriptional regulator [Chloroflexi bacterium]|nr:MAG: TetR/AcrR family transcriptional regulator [Chloroflexota bacterium]
MCERVNRRDRIIEEAARLFMDQGYAATSVRQIAEACGCTEAALYYHFKEGKRELLQAAVEHIMPDLVEVVRECSRAQSLHELVVWFAKGLSAKAREHMSNKVRWLMVEFPALNEEERALLYARHAEFRSALLAQIQRFVPDEQEAVRLAWMLIFIAFGYGQLMVNLDMQSFADFDLDDFVDFLAAHISSRYAEG